MSVVVLYTPEPERLVKFLSGFGLDFVPEKHGEGPDHWACQRGEEVLEVYPGSARIRFMEDRST